MVGTSNQSVPEMASDFPPNLTVQTKPGWEVGHDLGAPSTQRGPSCSDMGLKIRSGLHRATGPPHGPPILPLPEADGKGYPMWEILIGMSPKKTHMLYNHIQPISTNIASER